MATLTTQTIVRSGLNPSYSAAAGGGDAMATGAGMFLHVKNAGGGPITVTLAVPAAYAPISGLTIGNLAVSVTNAQERMIGPVRSEYFMNTTTGLCDITYSGVTSVTVGAFNLQQP